MDDCFLFLSQNFYLLYGLGLHSKLTAMKLQKCSCGPCIPQKQCFNVIQI